MLGIGVGLSFLLAWRLQTRLGGRKPSKSHSTRTFRSRTKLFLGYHLRLRTSIICNHHQHRNRGRLCSTKRIPSSDTLEPQLSLILEAIRKFSLSLCPPSPLLPTIRINTITPPGPAINWPLWQLLSYWLYAAGCSDSCSPPFFHIHDLHFLGHQHHPSPDHAITALSGYRIVCNPQAVSCFPSSTVP